MRTRAVSSSPLASRWLRTGGEAYQRMLEVIREARRSVRFEIYIFRPDEVGNRFKAALEEVAQRGVQVRILVDGFGSGGLPSGYWNELKAAGGEVRVFNPLTWSSFAFRDHRKLMVVDDTRAFVGGFNIGIEYDGDGIHHGWRDLGMELKLPLVVKSLAHSFDEMFRACDFHHRLLHRIQHPMQPAFTAASEDTVLLSGPRLSGNQFRKSLLRSLQHAKFVRIISGYFMPDFRLRRMLREVVTRGGRVELMLAGKSDVPLTQMAARALYGSLLKGGIKIWEYQPQVLHSKLAIVDKAVFVGSSNLDTRSFGINYEVMVRLVSPTVTAEAHELFNADQHHATEITRENWRASQTWFTRCRGFFARLLITKIDPWLARRQLRTLS